MDRLRIMFELLRTKSYVVALDNNAYVNIPFHDANKIRNSLIVSGQARALEHIRDNLDDLIKAHENRVKELEATTNEN